MGFFTTRERADLDKSTDEADGKIRDFVRRDFAPRRRPSEHERDYAPRRRTPDNDLVAGNAGALLQQVTGATLKQIDGLIVELQAHRQRLLSESALVQRAILEYAKMSQSTMQSTRIIAESLSYWNRIPDAPKIGDVDIVVDPVVDAEIDRELERSVAEALAQPAKDAPADAEAEATILPDEASLEPSPEPSPESSLEPIAVAEAPSVAADAADTETRERPEPGSQPPG